MRTEVNKHALGTPIVKALIPKKDEKRLFQEEVAFELQEKWMGF